MFLAMVEVVVVVVAAVLPTKDERSLGEELAVAAVAVEAFSVFTLLLSFTGDDDDDILPQPLLPLLLVLLSAEASSALPVVVRVVAVGELPPPPPPPIPPAVEAGSVAAAGGGGGGGGAAGQQQTVQLLRVLDLTGSGLTFVALPALLDAVAAWPPQKRLTVLVLGGNKCVGGSEGRAVLDNFKVDQGVDVQYDTEAEDEKEGEKEKNEEEAKQSDGGGGGSSLAAQKTAMPPPAPDAPPAKWIGQGPPTPAEAAAAALAPPASLAFKLGDSVTVQGLTTAARYNGKSGIVSSGLLNGRVAVWVEAEKKSISVKPENIEAASTPKA